jgi:hypothetical protein
MGMGSSRQWASSRASKGPATSIPSRARPLLWGYTMVMRFIVAPLTLAAALALHEGAAHARELPSLNPAVVCAPSEEQLHVVVTDGYQSLCLLRLSPWFQRTSFEVTPRAAKKRWGAALEFRF